MEKEDLYNEIENYLSGQLTGDRLANFEQLMSTDPDFKREVGLHRSLASSFVDPQKMKLRNSLDLMREEFKDVKADEEKVVPLVAKRSQRIWWAAAASVALLGLTWWFLLRKPADTDLLVKDPDIEQEKEGLDNIVNDPDQETTIPKVNDRDAVVKNDPKDDPSSNPDTDPQTDPKEDPIPEPPAIDYFAPNTAIANVINSIKDQRTHQFNIQVPAANETMTSSNGTVALYFKGELISFDYPETEKFALTIFDNQADSYQNGKPAFKTEMTFSKVEDGVLGAGGGEDYTFLVDQPVKLNPGLHYYLISLKEEFMVGGSFRVEVK